MKKRNTLWWRKNTFLLAFGLKLTVRNILFLTSLSSVIISAYVILGYYLLNNARKENRRHTHWKRKISLCVGDVMVYIDVFKESIYTKTCRPEHHVRQVTGYRDELAERCQQDGRIGNPELSLCPWIRPPWKSEKLVESLVHPRLVQNQPH